MRLHVCQIMVTTIDNTLKSSSRLCRNRSAVGVYGLSGPERCSEQDLGWNLGLIRELHPVDSGLHALQGLREMTG